MVFSSHLAVWKIGVVAFSAAALLLPTQTPSQAAAFFVNHTNSSPLSPYATWATAAQVIQDAVDLARPGDTVFVTNGCYTIGGRVVLGALTNRLVITNQILVRSVNGPDWTTIEGALGRSPYNSGNGDDAVRCVYVGAGATLSGFTLTNGHTQTGGSNGDTDGGGAWCSDSAVLTNCVVVNSTAHNLGGGVYHGFILGSLIAGNVSGWGGGAWESTLVSCTIVSNRASYGGGAAKGQLYRCVVAENTAFADGGGCAGATIYNSLLLSNISYGYGGGASAGSLYNCTVVGNSGTNRGGGADSSALVNCILDNNFAPTGSNWARGTLNFCCTSPLPPAGTANMNADPGFMNPALGDFRLRYGSPCIDTGVDLSVVTNDFTGNPRPRDGDHDGVAFLDIGAFEYNSSTVDSDSDGATDNDEWVSDTNPLDPNSRLRITSMGSGAPLVLHFSSSARRLYTLQYSTSPSGETWKALPGRIDVPGTGGNQAFDDPNATGAARFYRIQVRLP